MMDLSTCYLSLKAKSGGELALEGPKSLYELVGLALAPGQLLIRTYAFAIHPQDATTTSTTASPCSNCVGRIIAVGSGALTSLTGQPLHLGDFIYTLRTLSGAAASLVLCEAAAAGALPFDVSALGPTQRRARLLACAALPTPFFTACRALLALGLAPQQPAAPAPRPASLLVLGAASSSVGWAAAGLAASWGCSVLASAGCSAGQALLLQHGVCAAQGALRHDLPGALAAGVAAACSAGEGGVGRVVELGVVEGGLQLACAALARRGAIALLREPTAASAAAHAPTSTLDCAALAAKEGTLCGVSLEPATPGELQACALAFQAFLQQQQEGAALHAAVFSGLQAAVGRTALAAAAVATPLTGPVVVDCM